MDMRGEIFQKVFYITNSSRPLVVHLTVLLQSWGSRKIDAEVDRQIAEQHRSATSLTNRAVLLVSSALIFVSIPKDGDGSGWAYTCALIVALVAAGLGAAALFVRPKSGVAKIERLEEQLVGKAET
ncbi:hypothetical protein M3D57_10985, partial [Corynebacterium sanguinis]|nr:hypothetical protein [Corynebacterium sanguinis]MCT2048009.1 hypothetical protein [Corynebacterium sanguinis]